MKAYIVIVAFLTLSFGKIKLTEKQADKRKHGLEKTDEGDVYNIIGKIGFKSGEEFSYEGDVEPLIKAGLIAEKSDDSADSDDRKPDEIMSAILEDLRSKKDKDLYKLAQSFGIDCNKKSRVDLINELAARIYSDKKFDKIVEDLEALGDDELLTKAGEVGILAGDLNHDDLILAIAEKISEAVK